MTRTARSNLALDALEMAFTHPTSTPTSSSATATSLARRKLKQHATRGLRRSAGARSRTSSTATSPSEFIAQEKPYSRPLVLASRVQGGSSRRRRRPTRHRPIRSRRLSIVRRALKILRTARCRRRPGLLKSTLATRLDVLRAQLRGIVPRLPLSGAGATTWYCSSTRPKSVMVELNPAFADEARGQAARRP